MGWLSEAGIDPSRISMSQSLGWLQFDATVEEAETLLDTKYNIYEHKSGQKHVACHSYSIPEEIQYHVDFITPTVHFDAKLGPRTPRNYEHRYQKRDTIESSAVGGRVTPGTGSRVGAPSNGFLPKKGATGNFRLPFNADDISACDSMITPACLRALYKFPKGTTAHPNNK
jgi:tripeptidyl-peptidase-1